MTPEKQSNLNFQQIKVNYMAPFAWKTDSQKPIQQLYERAFLFCTEHLRLSKDLFTNQYQLFGAYKSQINLSGGQQWHNPTYALQIGLLHNIEPEQLQWYVILYHGVKNNQYFKQIFKTRLRPGPGQAFQGQRGRNPKLTVPNGIYGSQFMNVTMGYVDHKYPVVIKFATKPNSKENSHSCVMTSNKNIFVVQQAIPLKLVFPFNGVNRNDGFQ